jgi:hypothetical protein
MSDYSRLALMLQQVRSRPLFSSRSQRLVTIVFVVALIASFGIAFIFSSTPGGSPPVESPESDAPPEMAFNGAGAKNGDAITPAPKPTAHGAIDFESSLPNLIQQNGYLSVTVHVALYEDGRARKRGLGDGASPDANMYWGSRYGVDVHLSKDAGWTRVYQDRGDEQRMIRRSVFHRLIEPGDAWMARSVEVPFDLYVLAVAWPNSRIVEATEQPLREALCGETTTIAIEGRQIEFGAGSVITGFLGQNRLLTEYWDPFATLFGCKAPSRQMGLFYIAPRSAVLLHQPALDHGLYSILFAREGLTPEAYILSGMLEGLVSGELGDTFVTQSIKSYVKYQKTVRESQAKLVLMR